MFIELKCKSNFSFLRGATEAPEYILRAAELGMSSIGITDVNGVYGLPRAYECILKKAPHVKLICGAEITVKDHPPLTLIAQTRKAYGLLCRIITKVHADKEKGEGFLTLAELSDFMENFEGANNLVCLPEVEKTTNLTFLKELFGKNIYLPLCRYLDGLDRARTDFTVGLSAKHAIEIIATNDVHYHDLSRRPLQDALTCIREGVTIDTAGLHLFGNEERYLKSDLQMRALFTDLPRAIELTQEIADQCVFNLSELKYTYPHEFIPPGHSAKSYLYELVFRGASVTYKGLIPPKVDAQIRRELEFFAKRGDEHYFLTVQDIVQFAKDSNILCQGRGSAANSIVCYVLGITSVDPIEMNLLFDRFMNDGREEPPDIDVDFEHDRREEVIQYIYNRFGRERAAMVAAVRTYRSRSAFLELSKALGIEVGTISASELEIKFDELAKEKKSRRYLIDGLTETLKGFPRHLSIHSGGFVLSNDPLVEMVPIEPARMEGRTIIQWDKDDLETLGLMKVDILSIGFLTALHKATDLAGISWRDIPANDKPTYQMISRAETHGTFQIESRAQINMLVQTRPQNYYDLVVEVALVRPSPSKGGMVQPYLKGLQEARAGRPFKIGNAALESILGRTYGVPIFQEQIMQISMDIAGFNAAQADQLRRSLARSRSADSVDVMGKKLYNALVSQNVPEKFADDLFNYIQGYAHYGFPESHAASYASLAYKSAYMKCHHPSELLIGLINSQPMGFYPIDTLINEAKRNGVIVLPIDPNISVWDATLEAPKTIRMGFCNVRHAREAEVQEMIAQREQRRFISVEDFIHRTSFSKDVLQNLSLLDSFKEFGFDRRHSFWKSIEFKSLCQQKDSAQLSLFDEHTRFSEPAALFNKMSLLEEIRTDYNLTGYSLHGNFMKALRVELPHLPPLTSVQIKRLPRDRRIRYAGILTVIQRPPPAKGTAFITLEDEFGCIDTVFKSETFEKYEEIIRRSRFLIMEGKIQKRGLGTSVLVDYVETFSHKTERREVSPQGSPRGGRLDWS
ncbi:MAG: error-prone DNA polymerase [Bdellovibrionaceae bacterium]|nr:error-prone DNA polymerase [Bdellovibrio sp.]